MMKINLFYSFIDDNEQLNLQIFDKRQCKFVKDSEFDHNFDIDNILNGSCPCCFHENLTEIRKDKDKDKDKDP